MDKTEILLKFPFFRDAPADLRAEILAAASPVSLAAGDFFFQEGDRCNHLALVGSGRIRVYKSGESGREITLYHVNAGECCLLNISCLTSGAPLPAFAQAETALEALMIPGDIFRTWMSRHAGLQAYVFQLLAEHLAQVMALVEEVAFKRMDRRLAEYLLGSVALGDSGPSEVQATHERIAVDLGSAREVVSRLLKEFERMGAVRLHRGRVEVLDPALLRESVG